VEGSVVLTEHWLPEDHVRVFWLGLADVEDHLMPFLTADKVTQLKGYPGIVNLQHKLLLEQMFGG
jgi:hypothetical protein